MGNTLTDRQKESLYWRKRILYMNAAEERGGLREGYINKDTAEDAIYAYENPKSEEEIKEKHFPTGREFLNCPPSAAGERYYAASVASLMHVKDYLEGLSSAEGKDVPDVVKEVFGDNLSDVVKVIEKAIDDYFLASGIDRKTGKTVEDKEIRKKNKEVFLKSRRLYENCIEKYIIEYGNKKIKTVMEENGIKEKMQVDLPETDPDFDAIIAQDPGGAALFDRDLSILRQEIDEARYEAAQRLASRDALREVFFKKLNDNKADPLRTEAIMPAVLRYRAEVEHKVNEKLDTRKACLLRAKELLTDDEDIDILKEELDADVPENTSIPSEFYDNANADAEFFDREIKYEQGNKFLKEIPENYLKGLSSGEFNAAAVYEDRDKEKEPFGYYLTAVHADWLEIVWFKISDKSVSIDKKGRFIRHGMVSDIRRRKGKFFGAFTEFPTDEDMNGVVEALTLTGMDAFIGDSNIYEFKLSDVTGRDMMEKASERVECIPVSDADDLMRQKIDEIMRIDERPVPIPLFIDWKSLDDKISFICKKNDRLCGALLFSEREEYLVADLGYSADPIALPALIHNALEVAIEKYGEDKKVIVPVVVNKSALLVEKIVPDAVRGKVINGVMRFY